MKRNIIIVIILFLLFSLAGGIIYLNNVYLPVKIKGGIVRLAEEKLHYNVEIQKIKYNLIKGIILQDIAIYDKLKDKENTILTVKEVYFNFLFLPLFREKKFIAPIIHVDSPYLYIRYKKDNNFNFSKIFAPPEKQPSKQSPKQPVKPQIKFSFLVYKINIFDSKLVFRDEHPSPEFTKTVQDLNIGLNITPLAKISFLIQGRFLTEKEAFTKLLLQGEYNLLSQELNSKIILANLAIPEFNAYLKTLPVSFSSGSLENAALDLNFKNNTAALKGTVSTKGMEVKKENLVLKGDINVESELNYAIEKKEFDYKVNFKFLQTNLSGIPYVEKINNLAGDMGLTRDRLWTDNLKAQILDSPFTLKGTLENFSNPYLKTALESEGLNLAKLMAVVPARPKGLNLSGLSKAAISIEGYLNKLPLDIKANFDLRDAKLQTSLLKEPIDNIKGEVDFAPDAVTWLGLSFNYLNTAYTSAGKLVNFKAPQINFGLASKDLDLKSDLKIKDKIIRINTFEGRYINSEFDLKGNLDTRDNNGPLLDLSVKLNLKTPDVLIFLPPTIAETLKKTKLDGNLNIVGSINGKATDYRQWNVSLKTISDNLYVYNLKFNNLLFVLEEKNGVVNINRFTGSFYSGTIILDFLSDLKAEAPTYIAKLNCTDIDLEKLKSDTDLKNSEFSGILNIAADLNGNFKDISTLKGGGFLSIKNGHLWKLNLFKGLGSLFLLPDYEKIIFKETTGEFNIENKAISVENLKLISDQLNLECNGKLGFDGELDFIVYTQVNKNLIQDSADIRKFTTVVLGEFGNALAIKISGTIQKPKYRIVPMAWDLLKNIKNFLLGK